MTNREFASALVIGFSIVPRTTVCANTTSIGTEKLRFASNVLMTPNNLGLAVHYYARNQVSTSITPSRKRCANPAAGGRSRTTTTIQIVQYPRATFHAILHAHPSSTSTYIHRPVWTVRLKDL
jgi:hypothetical protein